MSEITLMQRYEDCDNKIIAVHDKYYIREISSGEHPNSFIGEDFDLVSQYGTTSALDTYFHAIEINGNTYFYPPAVTNPTTPILIKTNESLIQSFINSKLVLNGYNINDLQLIVNIDNSITIWRNPTYNYNGSDFWLGTITPNNYTNKTYPQIPTVHYYNPNIECIAIQEIKEKDSCETNEETYRYVIENNNGILVPVTDIYPEFIERSVKKECCGKQIIAVEQKYILRDTLIPSNYAVYWIGDLLSNVYGTGNDATNIYLHLLYGVLNGSALNPPIGTGLQDYFTVNQSGVLFTDKITIQNMVDYMLPLIGLNIGDIYYDVTIDNQPVMLLSPAAVIAVTNSTYLHIYTGNTSTWNVYDNNFEYTFLSTYTFSDLTLSSTSVPYCIGIQEIKYLNTCTGYYSYEYVIEKNGLLVPVIDVYTDFIESEVKLSCPEYTYNTKEVCGYIDGSTDCYEIFKIEIRDKNTGLIVNSFYENKENLILTSVEETCCTCDCLCQQNTLFNRICFGYATLFNGRQVVGDRITGGANFYIEYLWVNGTTIINTQTLIGTTTGGFTATNVGYGLAYNKIIDLLNSNTNIQNANIEFVPAAFPYTIASQYDPMGWGIKYNSADEIRIVLSDYIPISTATHIWSIRLHPLQTETYDAIGDARTAASWSYNDVNIFLGNQNLVNCGTI